MSTITVFDPDSVINSARHWRMRGEETRTLAEAANEPMVRAILLRLAADYDRLAKWAEERTERALRPPAPIMRRFEETSLSPAPSPSE